MGKYSSHPRQETTVDFSFTAKSARNLFFKRLGKVASLTLVTCQVIQGAACGIHMLVFEAVGKDAVTITVRNLHEVRISCSSSR